MTVICTDGETIAADDNCNDDFTFPIKKLFHLKDGRICGISGHYGIGLKMLKVLNGEIKSEDFRKIWYDKDDDGSELLIVGRRKRKVRAWIFESCYLEEIEVSVPYAIGSGSVFAMTAMDAGHNAKKAVELAIKRDPYCGGKVEVWEVPR